MIDSLELREQLVVFVASVLTKQSCGSPIEWKLMIFVGFFVSLTDLKIHTWQLAFDDAVYLVDAVVGGHALIQACQLGLESPYIIKVCHDCKRDSEVLFTSYLYFI